jgi:hypothetical protein
MYRPNFCSECGQKIIRLRWPVWASRRFCDKCAKHLRRARFTPLAATALALLTLGMIVGRASRPAPPPLIIERTDITKDPEAAAASPANVPSAPVLDVYLCGARTKKGTPCSRRVHGAVRCWQHKGAPPIRSPEQLLVKD